jgi:hypothetical protein
VTSASARSERVAFQVTVEPPKYLESAAFGGRLVRPPFRASEERDLESAVSSFRGHLEHMLFQGRIA